MTTMGYKRVSYDNATTMGYKHVSYDDATMTGYECVSYDDATMMGYEHVKFRQHDHDGVQACNLAMTGHFKYWGERGVPSWLRVTWQGMHSFGILTHWNIHTNCFPSAH
jgi:hypothetical protein